MITPESLYQTSLSEKLPNQKRKLLKQALSLGTDVVAIHNAYFNNIGIKDKKSYFEDFKTKDSKDCILFSKVIQSISSADHRLLNATLPPEKVLEACHVLEQKTNAGIEIRSNIIFLYSIYININPNINDDFLNEAQISNVDKAYLQVVYYCVRGQFFEAAEVVCDPSNNMPISPNIL